MARFKLTLEYEGTRYAGWQIQKNARSVQGEILSAAFKVFGTETVEIYGAGRTDAGVHARGQVAHLDTATRLAPEQIQMRLNDELPPDINILRAEPAPDPRFHARHHARYRSYTYQISKRRDAFAKRFVWWIRDPLDLAAMRAAAAQFVGFQDFRSFGDHEKEGASTLVELRSLRIEEDADRIYIRITGSHFLWKMVRRITGVLVEVGRGRMSVETVEQFLKMPSREPAKFTAPPSGLFLEKIEY